MVASCLASRLGSASPVASHARFRSVGEKRVHVNRGVNAYFRDRTFEGAGRPAPRFASFRIGCRAPILQIYRFCQTSRQGAVSRSVARGSRPHHGSSWHGSAQAPS